MDVPNTNYVIPSGFQTISLSDVTTGLSQTTISLSGQTVGVSRVMHIYSGGNILLGDQQGTLLLLQYPSLTVLRKVTRVVADSSQTTELDNINNQRYLYRAVSTGITKVDLQSSFVPANVNVVDAVEKYSAVAKDGCRMFNVGTLQYLAYALCTVVGAKLQFVHKPTMTANPAESVSLAGITGTF